LAYLCLDSPAFERSQSATLGHAIFLFASVKLTEIILGGAEHPPQSLFDEEVFNAQLHFMTVFQQELQALQTIEQVSVTHCLVMF
jgi:hypothetical protein